MESTPLVTNLSTHGGESIDAARHCPASAASPTSLPPMVTVISVVSWLTASICGGTVPSEVSCPRLVMSADMAPLQVTSVTVAGLRRRASTDG
jgi:hypothetical protein